MFEHLSQLPADPILGLIKLFREDTNPNKVDLGVGVYKDGDGNTPILKAVQQAQQQLLASQSSKAYVGPNGNEMFNTAITALMFGDTLPALNDRLSIVQTPGGCGALRVAAEFIKRALPKTTIWVSDPTWNNHIPLLGDTGLSIKTYPYFDANTNGLNRAGMFEALKGNVSRGDIVLLHGCCHNPTGVDLSQSDWQQLADLALEIGFVPFIDTAYQGFGEGLQQDVEGMQWLAKAVPECLFAYSCSKNFGLYRERVGAVGVLSSNSQEKAIAHSHLLALVRGIYSMPPDWGAAIVATILSQPELKAQWLQELSDMRLRIQGLRDEFSAQMAELLGANRFDFVSQQSGMFSFLGLSGPQVAALASQAGIYMLGSSRASIAGLNDRNMAYVCRNLAAVLSRID